MLAPQLTETEKQTMMTEVFLGYNHNLELADGEFYDMENLSADEYPLLSPRPRRGAAQAIEGVQGILAKDALCWVQNNTLYINGASMEAYMPSVSISAGGKAAHFHGRVSVHLPGRDLFQHREVLGQRVHGAGEHRQRGKHEH